MVPQVLKLLTHLPNNKVTHFTAINKDCGCCH